MVEVLPASRIHSSVSGRLLDALASPVCNADGVVALMLHGEGICILPAVGDDVHDLIMAVVPLWLLSGIPAPVVREVAHVHVPVGVLAGLPCPPHRILPLLLLPLLHDCPACMHQCSGQPVPLAVQHLC